MSGAIKAFKSSIGLECCVNTDNFDILERTKSIVKLFNKQRAVDNVGSPGILDFSGYTVSNWGRWESIVT